ncbi:MAG: radical SAM protein [Synechococcales bacterium]|nr:radical SAM protein [Synechococcales bacterium]
MTSLSFSPIPFDFASVYGPVDSWRFGRSLGIDAIGTAFACSFRCVYCQLGEIEYCTEHRRIFVPTDHVLRDLRSFAPWEVDVITFSGSGEPTLAANLGELIGAIKTIAQRPVVVLTNSTLLYSDQVRRDLAQADIVVVKLDAAHPDQLQRINRPAPGIHLSDLLAGLEQFRNEYQGHLAMQTMVLSRWDQEEQRQYVHHVRRIRPDEIQLNTPSRPRPLVRQLEARGNEPLPVAVPTQALKAVSPDLLAAFAAYIQQEAQIPVRCAPERSPAPCTAPH